MNQSKLYLTSLFLFSVFLIIGCDKKNSKNKDEQKLEQLLAKIKNLAESSVCSDNTNYELRFLAIGAKGCGGPTGYIGYSTSINVNELEEWVNEYTNLQKEYNKKWQIISDCMYQMPPKSVKCENGKPTLVYTTYN